MVWDGGAQVSNVWRGPVRSRRLAAVAGPVTCSSHHHGHVANHGKLAAWKTAGTGPDSTLTTAADRIDSTRHLRCLLWRSGEGDGEREEQADLPFRLDGSYRLEGPKSAGELSGCGRSVRQQNRDGRRADEAIKEGQQRD
jgi:hypothetical protein